MRFKEAGFIPDAVFEWLQGGEELGKLGDYDCLFTRYTAGIVSDMYGDYCNN